MGLGSDLPGLIPTAQATKAPKIGKPDCIKLRDFRMAQGTASRVTRRHTGREKGSVNRTSEKGEPPKQT